MESRAPAVRQAAAPLPASSVTTSARTSTRIDGLDGLRAVSIFIVLLGHGASTANAPAWLHPLREMGIVGVELFFAISGFIITHLLLRERARTGGVDLKQFWLRRVLRIVPPFVAAAAGIAMVAWLGYIQWSWPSFTGAITLTKNTPLFKGDWFFGHTWSLSLEEQFYLFWPLLFAAVLTPRKLILGLSLLIAAAFAVTPLTVAYAKPLQNILPFLPHLAAGCLFALMLREPRQPRWFTAYVRLAHRGRWLALFTAMTLAIAWARGEDLQDLRWMPLYAVTVPVAALLIIAEIALPDGRLRSLLSVAPLRWLGRISYSLYLWQQIFLAPADAYLKPWVLSSWPWNIFAAIACGALGYYLIEKPATRLKERWSRAASTSARARTGSPGRSPAGTKAGSHVGQPVL